MNLLSILLSLSFAVPLARAADSLDPELQRGLFEEEANQNFDAAIKAYQSVLTAHDGERKLAATALFRLGESYRKLGRTNDAITQYQRLVAEFPDQATLANLSRQNLIGLGAPKTVDGRRGSSSERGRLLEGTLAALQLEAAQAASVLKPLQAAKGLQRRSIAPTLVPDTVLSRLLAELSGAEQKVASLETTFARDHPDVRAARRVVQVLNRQIDERLEGIMEGLKMKAEALTRQTAELKKELAELTAPAKAEEGRGDSGQTADPAARAQLKGLLQDEVRIAEQFAGEQGQRVKLGTLAVGEEVRFERDVLNLKRQLVAVDGLASGEDRQRWRELLLEEIKLAEEAARLEKQKLDAGKSLPSEVARLQRDVLILKRELVTFDATPGPAPASGPSRLAESASTVTDEEEKEIRRIQALIKDSPDLVNARNVQVGMTGDRARYGTPLHKAAQQGQIVVARFLIENNADLDARDGFDRTPLHWAAINGHKSMAELLLSKGADPNASVSASAGVGSAGQRPLHFAAQNGYRNVCEALLAGKADLNARDANEATPLHLAAERGFSSVAELLLTRGANPNSRNSIGNTPLHSAAGSGSKRVVELLLAQKADLNAQNVQGGTPLHSAVNGRHSDVVRVLLASKADPNLALNEKAADSAGWTPLAAAISQDNVPMARLLLENGADANVLMSRNGWTGLMHAVQAGSLELVAALVGAGADVNAGSGGDTSTTALYFATSINPTNAAAIVELLLKNQADVNVADANGSTPLINAVSKRNRDVVKLLLEHGAEVNAMTRQGESPLSLIKPRRQPGGPSAFSRTRVIRPVGVAGVPGQPDKAAPDPTLEIIALLEQRGARDDLQRLSALSTSRNQEDRRAWFYKGTNDWNHFTLLELIAWVNPRRDNNNYNNSYLPFPDLSRIAIGRIDPQTAKTEDLRLDLATVLENGDCAKDLPLQWGDVVEIPEQDHFVDAAWDRFPDAYYKTLQKCLERTVRVTIKGQTTNVVLTPFRYAAGALSPIPGSKTPWESRIGNFRLNAFLRSSGLLLASSDVTRVKVKRTDPASKQVRERIFDLEWIQKFNDHTNDLWLRDGDVIEVPDK